MSFMRSSFLFWPCVGKASAISSEMSDFQASDASFLTHYLVPRHPRTTSFYGVQFHWLWLARRRSRIGWVPNFGRCVACMNLAVRSVLLIVMAMHCSCGMHGVGAIRT